MKIKSVLLGIFSLLLCSMVALSCSDDEDNESQTKGAVSQVPLTFQFDVENVTAYGFDVKITPSCDYLPYFADLVVAAEFDSLSDQQILDKYLDVLRWDEVMYGSKIVTTGKTLKPETEYALITFGIFKHQVNGKVTRFKVKTLEEVGPVIELTPYAKDDLYQIYCICPTKDATFASVLGMDEEQYNYLLDEFGNDWDIAMNMFDYAQFFPQEWIDLLNSPEGITISLGEVFYEQNMVCLFNSANIDNVHTVTKTVVEGPERPDPHTGSITTKMFAKSSEAYTVDLQLFCTSQNADDANLVIINAAEVDDVLNHGGSLEDVIETVRPSMTHFSPSWIESMNTPEGCHRTIESYELAPNTRWSILVEVTNADSRDIARVDVIYTDDKYVKYLTDGEFRKMVWDYETSPEWKFNGDKPCFIDFFATWCGPCLSMTPVISAVAATYGADCDFYTIDIDKSPKAYEAVRAITDEGTSIPFFGFVNDKGKLSYSIGSMSESLLREKIGALFTEKAQKSVQAKDKLSAIKFNIAEGKAAGRHVNLLENSLMPASKPSVVRLPGHFLR